MGDEKERGVDMDGGIWMVEGGSCLCRDDQ